MKRRTLPERLDALSMPEPNSGCRLWLGSVNATGYGLVVPVSTLRDALTSDEALDGAPDC